MGPHIGFYHKILSVFIALLYTMILSSSEIVRRLHDGDLVIEPYHAASQQPASYDLRACETTVLPRGECRLVASIERVELPEDLAGTLRCRSSFARRGVLLGGGFVDPGFRGHLTLCLTNAGREEIHVQEGDRVVQIVLHEVLNADRAYAGRYQDSVGVVHTR
jgi:dCTP deaminase